MKNSPLRFLPPAVSRRVASVHRMRRRRLTRKENRCRGSVERQSNVSYVVPLAHLEAVCAPFEAPWDAWPVVACGGMSIGHKGMIHAAKTLATTLVDLFESEPVRRAIRKEFEEQTQGRQYKPLMPDRQPPIWRDGGK